MTLRKPGPGWPHEAAKISSCLPPVAPSASERGGPMTLRKTVRAGPMSLRTGSRGRRAVVGGAAHDVAASPALQACAPALGFSTTSSGSPSASGKHAAELTASKELSPRWGGFMTGHSAVSGSPASLNALIIEAGCGNGRARSRRIRGFASSSCRLRSAATPKRSRPRRRSRWATRRRSRSARAGFFATQVRIRPEPAALSAFGLAGFYGHLTPTSELGSATAPQAAAYVEPPRLA